MQHITQKVLFYQFENPIAKRALCEFLEDHSFDFIGLQSTENYLGNKIDVFIPRREIQNHYQFHNFQIKNLPPKKLLEDMRDCEAQALKMMERTSRRAFRPTQYSFRKHAYLAQLTIAYDLLEKHGFDRVLHHDIPHEPFGFILHCLCKVLKVKSTFFWQLQLKDSFLHCDSIERVFDTLTLTEIEKNGPVPAQLPEHLQRELDERMCCEHPWYMAGIDPPPLKKVWNFYRMLRVRKMVRSLPSWRAYTRIKKIKPPADTPFVYFGLHMQPEATTSPMGGVFVEQFYAILMLARALPEGQLVLVKENPIQRFHRRHPDFYNILAKEPNIRFVSRKESTFHLIEQSIAVATINGTVGWEALFKKKPVFLFANAFYQSLPGIIKVNCSRDISDGMRQIMSGELPLCDCDRLKIFLHKVHCSTYNGITDVQYFDSSQMTPDDNNSAMKKALHEALLASQYKHSA